MESIYYLEITRYLWQMIKYGQDSLIDYNFQYVSFMLKDINNLNYQIGSIMNVNRIKSIFVIALAILLPVNIAVAADRGVFNGKSISQHELTKWEKNKMTAEFKSKFSAVTSGNQQSLGSNPWKAKKAKKQLHNQKMLQLSDTWGQCREFSYKQRGQCYARGGDAYTCERYYDARVSHCNTKF